jgi:hypothetical protein
VRVLYSPGRSTTPFAADSYSWVAWDELHPKREKPPDAPLEPREGFRRRGRTAQEAWRQEESARGPARREWSAETTVSEGSIWEASWCDAGGTHKLDVDLGSPVGGIPVQGLVTLLDRYGAEGWRVLHVSEDRGVYQGTDVPDESYVTRIRYLLVRS